MSLFLLQETVNRFVINPLSQWELRVEKYRVFYEADAETGLVKIKAVGYKGHNRLFLKEKEFKL